MKPKRLPKYALMRAWLMLAISMAVLSGASAIVGPYDPRIVYVFGMISGVQLWRIIKDWVEKSSEGAVQFVDVTTDTEELKARFETLSEEIERRESEESETWVLMSPEEIKERGLRK